jgi:hypothetical protein
MHFQDKCTFKNHLKAEVAAFSYMFLINKICRLLSSKEKFYGATYSQKKN